jgi:hypothetical protein
MRDARDDPVTRPAASGTAAAFFAALVGLADRLTEWATTVCRRWRAGSPALS